MSNDIVSTEWLESHLDSPDIAILDASWHLPTANRDPRQEFLAGHIPGAQFFDIDELSDTSSPLPHMLPTPEKFSSHMRKLGVGDGKRVIAYDAAGLFSAARCWWMFRYFGHDDVAVLDGGTLSKIFLGEITSWDDAAIKKLNPRLKLPTLPIVVVHRSDGSGTTFIWTDYLSKVSETWKTKVGANTSVEWPVGIGAKGNEGVANNVVNTKGAIGYVEYAYVKQNKMNFTKVVNRAGNAITPNAASFQAAAAAADWANADSYYVILTDEPGPKSWPIAGATFVLMHATPADPAASAEALKFFAWAYDKAGDKLAEELDYVPMPDAVVAQIRKTWATEFKSPDGKPLLP